MIKCRNILLLQISCDVTARSRPPDRYTLRVTSRSDLTQTANNFRFSTNMSRQCVLGGCIVIQTEMVSIVHQWPKDLKFARNWTRFVWNTRVWIGPTKCSHSCSKHFTEHSYETTEMARSCGIHHDWERKPYPRLSGRNSCRSKL